MPRIACFLLLVLIAPLLGAGLPGTQPLTMDGDIASTMVEGIDRFLIKELENSAAGRPAHWKRSFASPAAYEESIKSNRVRLGHILGVRDARVGFGAPELVTSTTRPSVVGKAEAYDIHEVRYPVLKGVDAEGLLLIPKKPNGIDIIAMGDADVLPEQLIGLTAGVAAESQFVRRLAESGCRVLVLPLIDRKVEKRTGPHGGGSPSLSTRELVYRPAFELGRHVIGYEVQKVMGAVDWFTREGQGGNAKIGVIGHGEGGAIALYAAALDVRIDAAVVSGYFDDRRLVWQQPIDRNVFGLLDQFGDAEVASMVAPRTLIIEAAKGPEVTIAAGQGGAPAVLATAKLESVRQEFLRAVELVVPFIRGTPQAPVKNPAINLMISGDGSGPAGTEPTLGALLAALNPELKLAASGTGPQLVAGVVLETEARRNRQVEQILRHTQQVLAESPYARRQFLSNLDTSAPEKYAMTAEAYRQFFRTQVVGAFNRPLLPQNARSRVFQETEKWTAYEVVLDVYPDVIAYGLLLLPKDLKEGEKRPVVVCQHGLEGRPQHVIGKEGFDSYKAFAAQLAERGFITFAPQNPYIFGDRFRTLQRKANPLGKTLFSIITPQHQQIINFLKTLPNVDEMRIGFYGLSYGGKTAMRVPALISDYALSICSADFNDWVWKNASTQAPYSYIYTGEYEIFEFDLGGTFNYAEMAALIAPRPFMVERGHFDGVAPDEAVAYEFAKVRHLFNARLKLPADRCQIEWFVGPHTINGQGTFEFLHQHLKWRKPEAIAPATAPSTRATTNSSTNPAKPQAAKVDNAKVVDASHPAAGAKGFDSALSTLRAPTRNTKPLKAEEAIKQFQTREGLAVDLIAAEPVVRQPLNIQFDERGRMWVTNYAQYPFPKGLKVVEYDRYIRAKFDKVPAPPPKHDRGEDKVTIHEDGDGDGTFEKVGTFVDGLNIVTSALPGRGGVWVLNPPYLLFYPDKDRDDVPDGDPVVHLSGFGLEDTHSVASSLMWGPDGWIYGAHGSTVTAKVKAELSKSSGTTDFLGQAIWRYHPERHVFELFAEGGGNTFGVEFDDKGRVFSGTNWGQYRGLHYVQGGYYIKGWGKHGPLTNPHAYGNFEHMPHSGNADRLTHTYIVYGGTLLKDLRGKIVGPNSLMSRVDVTRLEANASTFKTVEEEDLLVSRDGWFRPVDLKAGPDGAIYIADFYEDRISHVDPRDNWERSSGRIYRVRPKEWKAAKGSGDLAGKPSAELVELLKSEDRWHRQTAMRLLHDRRDASVAPALREMLLKGQGQTALEALWGLNAAGALDEASGIAGLSHGDPHVRAWTIRLLADGKAALPEAIAKRFVELASGESDATVRSQMASSAKRLPAEQGMMIVRGMLAKDDSADPHIPLLLWWAVESKSVSDREAVLSVFAASDAWQSAVARGAIFPRLARRYAADGSPENQQALLRLLSAAPGDAERAILLSGVRQALDGTAAVSVSAELSKYFVASGDLELAARAGDLAAHSKLLELARDESSTEQERVRRVALLGQLARPGSGEVLLELVAGSKSAAVRRAAMQGLKHFDEPAIGQKIVAMYPALDAEIKAAAIGTLTTRANGIVALLKGVEAGVIAKEAIGPEHRARIADQEDKAIEPLAVKVLGQPQRASSAEKEREVERIRRIVSAGGGDTGRGETTFTERCAGCHALHGKGAKIAPDLTPYDRSSLDFLLLNTIDPSSYIRDEYTQFRIKTRDKQTLYGLVSERNATHVTITDSGGQRTTIPRSNIADERGLATSIMPEGLLEGLNDQQLRDLVAYLQKK